MTTATEPTTPVLLNIKDKQPVEYAIPLWLRDLQIKHALSLGLPIFGPTDDVRTDPVAVVCFGPSLADTWEELRAYKHIITCSGSHKFLIERGIIPNWHVEVDPRAHKVELLGQPHKDVTYLISSTCHGAVFAHLKDYTVNIWHVFDAGAESGRFVPRGQWALTGGCGVGLRAVTVATMLGFRDIHIYGMDGNESDRGKHAAKHPNEPKKHALVEYPEGSGRMWKTTHSMLEAARTTFYECDQFPKCTFTFHGEGLVQTMAKDWTPGAVSPHAFTDIPAILQPHLISDTMRDLNAQLHRDNAHYGIGGHKYAQKVVELVEKTQAQSVLDYGAGKGTLAANLPFPIWEYDPAIPEKAQLPRAADLVLCFDVLEHVEPEHIHHVLAHLSKLVKKVGYFVIHTGPAKKTYADGRNTHLIQQGKSWWEKKLKKYFTIGTINETKPELHVVVGPKAAPIEPSATATHDGTSVVFYTPNEMVEWRVNSLFTKEPCTIAWIDTFQPGDVLWDVGANMGGYSVWAHARRQVKVYAFEPEANNYALLCRNMTLNKVDGNAYCLALTDQPTLSTLFVAKQEAGSSCNSFAQEIGPNLMARPGLRQGAIGMTLDQLTASLPSPAHIKIDVDGLEHHVLAGGATLLKSGTVKSLLVEVNQNLPAHLAMIETLKSYGYTFDQAQVDAALRKEGAFKGCAEYVLTQQMTAGEQAVLQRIIDAPLEMRPFPHLDLDDFLPQAVYDELIKSLPPSEAYQSLEAARGTRGYPQRFVHPAPAFLGWMTAGRLRACLDQKFGVTSSKDETLLIRDHTGYQITPHTDTPAKAISMLIYLGDTKHGTSLYTPAAHGRTDPYGLHHKFEEFREVCQMPAKPNSVFIFARTDTSFHGTKPYLGTVPRDVLLYDSKK